MAYNFTKPDVQQMFVDSGGKTSISNVAIEPEKEFSMQERLFKDKLNEISSLEELKAYDARQKKINFAIIAGASVLAFALIGILLIKVKP